MDRTAMDLVLLLWQEGLVSDLAVVHWADDRILAADRLEEPLIQLSLQGPKAYLGLDGRYFPKPGAMEYSDAFAFRAVQLDLGDSEQVQAFADWLCNSYLSAGEGSPERDLGNRIDYGGFWRPIPENLVRTLRIALPAMIPDCRRRVADFLSGIDGLPALLSVD